MNLLLIFIGVFGAVVLGLLLWSAGSSAGTRKQVGSSSLSLSLTCKHVTNLSQIRQALDSKDFDYLAVRLDASKLRELEKERRQVVLKYLAGLKGDFERLLETAQIVASLSPEVEAKEEWKRFRLALRFRLNYQIARAKFTLASPTFPGLENLANIVSSLEIELEKVVTDISLAAMTPGESGSTQG